MFRDPNVPASYVEVDVLRSWLDAVLDPDAGPSRERMVASLHQRIQGALATHNPPTGEFVVEAGHFLQVLTECTCAAAQFPGTPGHEAHCQLDVFGPVENFVRPLRKAGYVVIEPGAVEEMLTPEPPADVDACVCDVGPDTDGPSIECPQHGEPAWRVEERQEREFRQFPADVQRAAASILDAFGVPEAARISGHGTYRDEVGDRQLRLREAAQRLKRVGHDLGSTELLAISRDLTAELGPGWSETPTVAALSGSLPSAGSGDTGEPPLGATLSQKDTAPADRCDPARGTHVVPHRGCFLR